MIISKTPYRISFFGGGTDLPQWASEFGGMVISTTIDKYCYISCRQLLPFFDYKFRLVYSQTELVNCLNDIKHPGIRGVFKFLRQDLNLEIHHDGDLPARSGLGSSSSFTVGLLHAINALLGVQCTPAELAKNAIFIEQEINREIVGSQDQVAASFGGFNKIAFKTDGQFEVSPLAIEKKRSRYLNDHLLLFYTGIQRRAPEIETSKVANISSKEQNFRALMDLVTEAQGLLLADYFDPLDFGKLLHESWLLKRDLAKTVTSSEIDSIYATGISAGAVGGKVLGAGGGGFVLFLAAPERHLEIKRALSNLVCVDFAFENEGSTTYRLS